MDCSSYQSIKWSYLAGPSPLESNWKWSPERPDEDDDGDGDEEEEDDDTDHNDTDDDEKLSSDRPDEEHLPLSICYPVDVCWQPVQILFNDSALYKEQTGYLFLIKIKTEDI